MSNAIAVECYAHCVDDYNFSAPWAVKVLNVWIQAKKSFVADVVPPSAAAFKKAIVDGIIEAADWQEQFSDAWENAGLDLFDAEFYPAYAAYVEEHRQYALDLVPDTLHTEFRWIPEWTWGGLDEVMDTHGLKTAKWQSNYIEDIVPGEWLARFLKLVNVSSHDLVVAAIGERATEGPVFANRVAEAGFVVEHDCDKPSLLTPLQVVVALENAYPNAVLVVHAEIELLALLALNPVKPMVLSTDKGGEVHIGFHDFVNGAGYMDTYKGSIVIPANETGFTGSDRWSYGIDKVYCLYKPALYTEPKNV